jgi:acyl-CoA synthetase (AMP-forming)/AMP-acid ligase II
VPTLLNVLEAGQDDHLALTVPDGPSLSYRRLREEVARGAEVLAARGIRRGDRVALVYPNSAEAVVLFLSAAVAGTAAPLNPAYKADEHSFYLLDTRARALLVPPGGGESAREALPIGALTIEAAFGDDSRLRFDGNGTAGHGVNPAAPAEDDIALVLHTSGTTSRPKMVPLRHRHLAASVANIVPSYELTADDVSLCLMPLFHVHGLLASALATLASGGTVVIPARFSPFEFWSLAQSHRVTWYSAVPTIHQMLVGRGRRQSTPSLRFARSCSSALTPALMGELEGLFSAPVVEAYGMTEASHQMASNPLPPRERRPGSVGTGTGVEVAILNETGAHLPIGALGEVAVRGPNVMDGYEANPVANAEAFASDGWFRTGDQGRLDADGYLTLTGRIKELINRGGEKIAPREVDEALLRHPAVAEAVAFAVPHPTWGEEVAAAVVLKGEASQRELIEFCRRQLADFKVPRHLYFVTEIPRTATGKIQRKQVAAALNDH